MTVVCLHGFAQTPAIFAELAPEGAIVPPLPGHAGTPAVESFDEAVETLAQAIPPGACLAGYSLGARIALAICLRHPERVQAALLVGAGVGIDDPAERAARRAWDDEQAAFLEREGLEGFVTRWEALPIFATQSEAARHAQRRLRLAHDPVALAAAMRALGQGRMPPLWSALPGCRVPLRLLVGDRDAKYRDIAERVIDMAPSASLRVVAGGHNLLIEAPDAVREELARLATYNRATVQ